MRRYLLVLVIGLVALVPAAASGSFQAPPSTPVDATPSSDEAAAIVTVLGSTQPEESDQRVMLIRIELPPGVEAGANDLPGTAILYVESGTVSYRLDAGEASVVRAGEVGAGTSIEAGSDTWIELSAGDRVVERTGARHVYGNHDDTTAVLLLSGLYIDQSGVRCSGGCWGD